MKREKDMSKILGFEKFSIVDFDKKMSCTIFISSCNFRCPFCHNSSLVFEEDGIEEIKKEDILKFLERRVGLLDAVVISGGEPTMYDGLEELIDSIKVLGFLVKLDTNGTNPKLLKKLIDSKKIDYVAMDIKNSKDKYFLTTGISNQVLINRVMESVKILEESNIDYEFRTTLVNEFHTLESIKEMGMWLKGAKRLYLQKFEDKGSCIKDGLSMVSVEDALLYKAELEKYINDVNLRGYDYRA